MKNERYKIERRIAKARRRLARHVAFCYCPRCTLERITIDRLHARLWEIRPRKLDDSLQTGDYERYMRGA